MSKEIKITNTNNVHTVLAQSYMAYFFSFLLGLSIHFLYPLKISEQDFTTNFGLLLLFLSTLLIFWAQNTSRNLDHEHITKESFCRGPYCYTRTPTHFGLFLLILGFSLMINSLFVALFTLLSFIISKTFFLKKQEAMLFQKYGVPYMEYKKSVKF
jgi:protein-S-isoprenylcysteine O-methyltransferase Ste14